MPSFDQSLQLQRGDESDDLLAATDFNYAYVLRNKGAAYLTMGNITDALTCLTKAWGNFSARKERVEIAITMQHLAEAYKLNRELDRAIKTQLDALEILKDKLGEEDFDVGTAWNSLGLLHQERDESQLALQCFQNAVKIWEKSDEDKQIYASILDNFALAHQKIGELSKKESEKKDALDHAVLYFSKALEIWETLLRQEHPQITRILNQLGDVYFVQKDFLKAKECYSRALENNKKFYGEGHLDVAKSFYSLASIAFLEGDLALAANLHRAALKIRRQHYMKGHLNIVENLIALSKIHQTEGNFEEAREYAKEAIVIKRSNKLNETLDFALTLDNLGGTYLELYQLEEALACFLESSAIKSKVEKSAVPSSTGRLGHIYLRQGKFEEARTSFHIALATAKVKNSESLETAPWNCWIGMAYLEEEKLGDAKIYFSEAQRIGQKIKQGNNEQHGRALRGLGEILIAEKDPKGINLLLESLNIMRCIERPGRCRSWTLFIKSGCDES